MCHICLYTYQYTVYPPTVVDATDIVNQNEINNNVLKLYLVPL